MAGEDRRINVGLSFTADTSKAREALDKLRQDISKVTVGKEFGVGFDDAITRIQKFQGILETARNTAGGLDLTKLNKGLSAAGMNLDQVFLDLNKIGANDAFQSLGTEILNANANVSVLHGALKKFADGLKNTAMWTIQSNAIHAVESALSNAYGYAQKLNKGLTDIAIVSDLNTQQLTEFARTANQMAKELSASTADYVSGALIYYQAGLSDEEVIERTNTTLKLAETSGESAEAISSYMTAIWNNFYDGSKSVEYYADAISYLGAVTAASNADIAEGMQSFAAVADTVGLSFEYGASALTLLRDITQQSASTIGNSLKTIFARLSSVAQGDTLEDGVNYTKYSKALDQVGVSVLDVNGDLRDMDDILDDLGARWNSLNSAQKVALAQTVGGVRQYNNLISLMDNYEQFQELVQESSQSDGYLQGQADEYAESWEAAANRLEAAWQGIYDQIIDDKFFIKLTNFLTGIVNFIGDIIDGLGGLKGVIPFIVMTVTSINPEKTALGLEKIVQELINFKNALDGTQKSINVASQNTALKYIQGKIEISGATEQEMEPIYGAQEKLAASYREINALRAEGKETEAVALAESAKRYDNLIELYGEVTRQLVQNRDAQEEFNSKITDIDLNNLEKTLGDLELYQNIYNELADKNSEGRKSAVTYAKKMAKNPESFGLDAETGKAIQDLGTITKKNVDQVFEILEKKLKDLQQQVEQSLKPLVNKQTTAETETTQQATAALQEKANALDGVKEKEVASANATENATTKVGNQTEAQKLGNEVLKEHNQLLADQQRLEGAQANVSEKIGNYSPKSGFEGEKPQDWSKTVTSITRTATAMLSLNSAMDAFSDNINGVKINIGSLISSMSTMLFAASQINSTLNVGTAVAKIASSMGGTIPAALVGPAGVAAVLAIGAALKIVFDLFSKETKELEKNASEQHKLNQKQFEAIDATQDLSESVLDLTNSYKKLSSAGKSTFDTINDLKEQLPNLIKEYEKLDKVLDNIDLSNLIEQLRIARDSQDWEQVGKIIEKINGITTDAQVKTSQDDVIAARNLLATSGQGRISNGQYSLGASGFGRASRADWELIQSGKSGLSNFISQNGGGYLGGTVALDKIGEYYESLVKAQKELQIAEKTESQLYKNITKEISAMSEAYGNYMDAVDNNIAKSTIHFNQNGLIGDNAGLLENTSDMKAFEQNRDQIIAAIAEQYGGISEDAAEQILRDSESFGFAEQLHKKWLNAVTVAPTDSENTEDVENAKKATQEKLQRLSDWYSGVDDAYKQFAINVVYDPDNLSDEALNKGLSDAIEAWRKSEFMTEGENRGFDTAEMQEYADYLASIADDTDKLTGKNDILADSLTEDSDAALLVARSVMSLNKGVEALSSNWDDWGDILKNSSKESKEYYEALKETKNAIADMFEVSTAFVENDFIATHLKDIGEAATGDEEAIERLRQALADDIIVNVMTNQGFSETQIQNIQNQVDALRQYMDDNPLILEPGFQLDKFDVGSDEFLQQCQKIIEDAGMTVEQANAFFDALGFETTFETKPENVERVGHQTITTTYVDSTRTINTPDGGTYTFPDQIRTETRQGDPYTYNEQIEVPAMATNGKTPIINSITRKASAPMNNRSSSNRGGSGSKSSSGGSSSKQKTKEPERYHEINAKIQQNQAEITKLTALENRLYGQEKLDAMEREAELLEEQAKLYEQKYQEALRYYEMDKKNLQNNYGATFNPDGTIANYDEWYGKYLAQYNSGKMDDDAWSKFEDAIKKYEESLNLLDETEKAKLDATNKAFDKGLENIEYRLKTINELIDKDIDYLDYMIKQLDKSMYDTADVIALIGKKTEDVYQKTLNEQKAIEDILKHHGGLSDEDIARFISGQEDISDIIAKVKDLTETEVKNLMEHQSALIKYNETLIELREDAYEKLGESIDEFNDKIERQKDIINDLDGVMNHYRNIIDIVGKDTLGISDEMLRQMSELSVTAAKGALEISRDELTKNQAMLEVLYKRREELLAAGREADARLLDKEIEAQEDRVRQLSEAWASAWEDALHAAEEAFKNSITLATDAFSQAMAGTIGSLDDLQEAMDMQNTLNERYLPTYQKIYELNKLTRDVNNAIDNTNNIAGKERLLKLQQDIVKKQEDGAELTEYELGMFQRRLELEQARIAMEEAQNAKNMVRMTRDSEGNWSYTYTADSEAAAQAEQNYEDKLYDLKKYNQDSMKEFEDAMWQAVNEYKNSIADLDLTDEERAQRIHDFQQQWVEHNKDMFQMTLDDAQWILDTYGGVDDLINTFMETISGKTTQYSDLTDFFNQFNESSQQMMDEVGTSYRTWDEQYKDIFEKAGTSADDFKDKVTEDMKAIEESIVGEDGEGGAVGAAKKLGDQMTEQFDGIMKNLRKWFEGEDGGYSKMIDSIVSQNEKLYGSIQALLSAYAKLGQVSNFAGDNKDIKVGEVDTGTGQGEIPGFASGGYTGSWGNTGRLAVLHEKELVLNQADTENLLTTVNFVRDLTRMISLNAADASSGLGNLFMGGVGQGGGYLDQTVTIHAEFPNATNHSEIEEAFSNLIGLASQYAGRKK